MLSTCRSEIDSRHYSGVTRDGRPFMKYDLAQNPPLSEIQEYELYVLDNDGNETKFLSNRAEQ